MLRGLFKSKEAKFWDWFASESGTYYRDLESKRDELFAKLTVELRKLDPNLTFEFSQVKSDGIREFILSADGIKKAFPAVIRLVQAAPSLSNWKIIAFRQPKPDLEDMSIRYGAAELSINDIAFRYMIEPDKRISIQLNIKGYEDTPAWKNAGFLFLDALLGEYDTETMLDTIDFTVLEDIYDDGLFRIQDLRELVREQKAIRSRNN